MPRPNHTERNAGIVALYRDGQSTVAIGKQIGMTDERVRQILAKAGVARRGHSARTPDAPNDHAAVDEAGAEPHATDAPQAADGL